MKFKEYLEKVKEMKEMKEKCRDCGKPANKVAPTGKGFLCDKHYKQEMEELNEES